MVLNPSAPHQKLCRAGTRFWRKQVLTFRKRPELTGNCPTNLVPQHHQSQHQRLQPFQHLSKPAQHPRKPIPQPQPGIFDTALALASPTLAVAFLAGNGRIQLPVASARPFLSSSSSSQQPGGLEKLTSPGQQQLVFTDAEASATGTLVASN